MFSRQGEPQILDGRAALEKLQLIPFDHLSPGVARPGLMGPPVMLGASVGLGPVGWAPGPGVHGSHHQQLARHAARAGDMDLD